MLAAVSVGVVNGKIYLDLNYEEDSTAEVDANIVMTDSGKFIEIQSTAEGNAFTKEQMDKMIEFACKGIDRLIEIQKAALKGIL